MKLTENQLSVLAASELDSRLSASQLAKHTGLREHVVRQARDFLLSHECYRPYVWVHAGALGFIDFAVYVRRGMSARERDVFVKSICQSRRITWLVELGGKFQFCFSFLGRTVADVDDFLVALSEKCGAAYQEHHIAPRIHVDLYPHRFLYEQNIAKERLTCAPREKEIELDIIDKKVLRELCFNPEKPVSLLARDARMPTSSFQYRLDALIKNGVILGFPHYLNYPVLGIRKYILLVYEQQPKREFRKRFELFCAKHKHITTCLRALAEWTYELDVQVLKAVDLSRVTQEILEEFRANISRIESLEYLTTHKMVPYPGILDSSGF